ncbi:MAG: T9SS type A sorting domain-containing protein, partial [Schleiferiaceae bacterium]
MYNNQGANTLLIRNDQTFAARSGTKYMYLAALGNWYSGYSNSLTFNNLWIRSINCPASNAANCMATSVGENPLSEVVVAPNPASDFVYVNFGLLFGEHAVEVLDLTGKVVKSTKVQADANVPVFVGDLESGLYMVRIAKGADVKTFKVSVL